MTLQTTDKAAQAVETLCNAAMQATANIIKSRGIQTDDGIRETICRELRIQVKVLLDEILIEWREATEANLGEQWLRRMVATQGTDIAIRALKMTGHI